MSERSWVADFLAAVELGCVVEWSEEAADSTIGGLRWGDLAGPAKVRAIRDLLPPDRSPSVEAGLRALCPARERLKPPRPVDLRRAMR